LLLHRAAIDPHREKDESDADYYKTALDTVLPLGKFFQIQDDCLGLSGTPEQIARIDTDIMNSTLERR
jgi:geranylgeranyl pyrophosphate synthase